MPIMGDIKNLYSDKNQSRALFPTTKIKAVSDDGGKGLNAVLDDMTAHTRKVGNPYNLLDNSDFRNPVNQRGQTSYANTMYTIDRWKWSYAATTRTVTINDKSISISNQSAATGYFEQLFEKALKEGAYTIAVKVDGVVYSRVITAFGQNQVLQLNGTTSVYLTTGGAALTFIVNSGGALNNIAWVALYEGEYTAETLPEYQPKGYAAELMECRRYYRRKKGVNLVGYVNGSGKGILYSIETDEPFYKIPTMNIISMTWIRGLGPDGTGLNLTSIPAYTISRYSNNNISPVFSFDTDTNLGFPAYSTVFTYCEYELTADL